MSPRRVDDVDVARWRFRSLLLDGASAPDAPTAVRSLLAVQAENLDRTGWAVASRTSGLTPAGVAHLVGSGELVRTHVLRPTWHLVHRADVRWLLELTGPRIRRQYARMMERDLALPPDRVAALGEVVEEAIERRSDLARDALADELRSAGHELSGQQLMLLLLTLELEQRICSGVPVADGGTGSQTYAPFATRVPDAAPLERDEALARLARRYLAGHGPATDRDLAYWATLTLGDARAGIASVAADLESFEHDGRTYWHLAGQIPPSRPRAPRAHLVHLLDEWYRGYQDSRRVVDAAGLHPAGRESSMGVLVVDAQIAGTVRRTARTRAVELEVSPYRALTSAEERAVAVEADAYGAYLDREVRVTVLAPPR